MNFQEIVRQRYAVKRFNGESIPRDIANELFEIIRFAPSSFGLQPWKVKVVTDMDMKEKLYEASWYQEQVKTCSHLLVFCADTDIKSRIDIYEEMMRNRGVDKELIQASISNMRKNIQTLADDEKRNWAQRQTYIALANAVNGAKALGLDSCPMEGFVPEKYAEILDLPDTLIPSALVTVGYRADTEREKIRFAREIQFF